MGWGTSFGSDPLHALNLCLSDCYVTPRVTPFAQTHPAWCKYSQQYPFSSNPCSDFGRLYGRNAGYPAPPVQSRTCSFPASGSSVVLASAVQSQAFRQTLSDVEPP